MGKGLCWIIFALPGWKGPSAKWASCQDGAWRQVSGALCGGAEEVGVGSCYVGVYFKAHLIGSLSVEVRDMA